MFTTWNPLRIRSHLADMLTWGFGNKTSTNKKIQSLLGFVLKEKNFIGVDRLLQTS